MRGSQLPGTHVTCACASVDSGQWTAHGLEPKARSFSRFVPRFMEFWSPNFPKCGGPQGGISRPTILSPRREAHCPEGTHTHTKSWTVDSGQSSPNLAITFSRFVPVHCLLSTVQGLASVCVCPLDSATSSLGPRVVGRDTPPCSPLHFGKFGSRLAPQELAWHALASRSR